MFLFHRRVQLRLTRRALSPSGGLRRQQCVTATCRTSLASEPCSLLGCVRVYMLRDVGEGEGVGAGLKGDRRSAGLRGGAVDMPLRCCVGGVSRSRIHSRLMLVLVLLLLLVDVMQRWCRYIVDVADVVDVMFASYQVLPTCVIKHHYLRDQTVRC
jgi:hypothetical protein